MQGYVFLSQNVVLRYSACFQTSRVVSVVDILICVRYLLAGFCDNMPPYVLTVCANYSRCCPTLIMTSAVISIFHWPCWNTCEVKCIPRV